MDPLAPEDNLLKTGPALVGIVLNWWLWGILIMQYLLYMSNAQAKNDHQILRGIIHFLFLLEAVQSILVIADAFHWFVYNFGDYNGLLDLAYSSIDGPILDSFIAFVVQLVYCWRIWVLSRRRIAIPAIIALCALVSCIGGFVRGIKGYTVKRTPGLPGHLDAALILWNTAGALTDILIASSMTYLLLKLSSESTNHGVLRVMRRIGLLTLEANILTAIVAIAIMIVVLIKPIGPPYTTLYLSEGYVLGKLHSNCFMVLLNHRIYYTETTHSDRIHTKPPSLSSLRSWGAHLGEATKLRRPNSVIFTSPPCTEVHVEVRVDRDVEQNQV